MSAEGVNAAQRRAVEFFRRGGCVRTPNEDRLAEGSAVYKKGWEVRFTLRSRTEATELQQILRAAGVLPGKPYRKTKYIWILPLYGRDQVGCFLEWAGSTVGR